MGKYAKQIWISAAPGDVIDAIDTPDTWRVITPSMQNAEVVQRDGSGYRLEYAYKLAGVRIDRAIEMRTDSDSESRRVFELSGPITGAYTFEIEKQGTGTRVRFDAEYTLSTRVIDRVTRRFADQYLARQFDSLLGNLKHAVEMDEVEMAPGPIEE
jgi:carbon monoxide dehydrogenase subunit G